jgi:murein DD-endopeptidase MepM/ murein hydrolase activator NlpD
MIMTKYLRSFAGAALLLIIIFCTAYIIRKAQKQDNYENTPNKPVNTPEAIKKYGLPVDSFIIENGTVKPNQHLSNILSGFGIEMGIIDQIARKSKPVFDVRKIRSGNKYSVFKRPDSPDRACYFIYENSATDYYVFELFDTLRIYQGEKKIQVCRRTASGIIQNSLWNTMKDNDLDPMLALELSDIFAWTIDFFAIQKGDRFRVLFDELFVDSTYIGIGEIYAVQFNHYGEKNYAFRFYQDNRYDYFDETGVSLRKAFLKAPLRYSRVSSGFSYSRMHPILRIRRPHLGIDYAAPRGTPVMSIGDGTVIARSYQRGGGGNYLKIKHNSVYTTVYMHLSGFTKGIHTGVRVRQGQVIGYVGSTGLSTGPHLDFRVFKNGKPFNPLKVEAPPVEPVKKENLQEYTQLKDSLMTELHNIGWDEILASSE